MINDKYNFLNEKTISSNLQNYFERASSCNIIVHHLAHIIFIKKIITNINKPLCLVSPVNAAAYMGVRWWLSFMEVALPLLPTKTDNMLDCADNAGLAMAALRLGQSKILFSPYSPQLNALKFRAKSINSHIITDPLESFDLTKLHIKIPS